MIGDSTMTNYLAHLNQMAKLMQMIDANSNEKAARLNLLAELFNLYYTPLYQEAVSRYPNHPAANERQIENLLVVFTDKNKLPVRHITRTDEPLKKKFLNPGNPHSNH